MSVIPTIFRARPAYLRAAWLPAVALLEGGLLQWSPFMRAIDYPLSLVGAPFMAMCAAVLGVLDSRRRPLPAGLPKGLTLVTGGCFLFALPAALTSVWSGAVCEPLYGLLFLLLGPICSGAMGLILGHAMGTVMKPALALTLVPLLLLASVAMALAEFLWSPGVRFYGTLFGLYHGAVYDEAVFVEWPYIWLRVWNLCGAVAMVAFIAGGRGAKQRWWLAGGLAALIWICGGVAGPHLGFVNSTSRLERELSGSLVTAHFEVRFRPGGRAASWAPLMAADMEFRGAQIRDYYGLPEQAGKVTAFLYESPRHKAAFMGAGQTSIAKPWLRQLHVHTLGVGGRLLHHELAHALLADAANSLLAMPAGAMGIPRPGLLEGAAVAVERGGETLTTHQWARAMRDAGLLPDMPTILEHLAFWSQSSSRAYTACGSFVRFLVEDRGPASFLALYGGAEFAEAYGGPLSSLLAEWHEYLDGVPLTPDDLDLAEFAFSRPPVFQRQCPYAGGRCLLRVQSAAVRGDRQEAAALSARGLRMTDMDLNLGRRLIRVLLAVDATEEALALLELMWRRHPEPGLVAGQSLRLNQGDSAWLQNEPDMAREVLSALHSSAFARLVFPALELRMALLTENAPWELRKLALGAALRREVPTLLAQAEDLLPHLGPAGTLQIVRSLAGLPDGHDRARELCTTEMVDALPGELRFEGLLLRLRLAVMAGDLELGRSSHQALMKEAHSEVREELLADWEKRIQWLATIGAQN